MPQITHIATISGPFAGPGSDILALEILPGGQLWALAGYGGAARVEQFQLAGTLTHQSTVPLGSAWDGFETANLGGQSLSLSHFLTSQIAGDPSGDGWVLTDANSGLAADQTHLVSAQVGGTNLIVATKPEQAGLTSLFQGPSGALTFADTHTDATIGPLSDLAVMSAYGQTWIVAASPALNAVQSYHLSQSGALTPQASFGAAEGLGLSQPTDLACFQIGGQPYVIVAGAQSNSLSVLRLEADGSFTATDHILDDLTTRFATPHVVRVVQNADATFVLAAGSDDGISLFQVSDDGQLFLVGTVIDSQAITAQNIADAALMLDGGVLHLFTSSASEIGLSHFQIDIANMGPQISGSAGADSLTGTSKGEIINGGAGDDDLHGGAGDDRIIDGAGADQITGGAGADIFTLGRDGVTDVITDFERGQDALDLSLIPLLHDMSGVSFVAMSWGARLIIHGEWLDIHSSDGLPLTLAELTARWPFPIDRPPLILSPGGSGAGGPNTQVGSGAADVLTGGAGADILTGGGGDDVLIGGEGADQLLGGPGFDSVSYANATAGVTVDLANTGDNTGDAAGDLYGSIEQVIGSGFADTLFGSAADDHLNGAGGNDRLSGAAGADSLTGGAGDDLLIGGSGADHLIGGTGSDTASYATATSPVRVDLTRPYRGTGDAAGDQFTSIENLTGSAFGDHLYGDGQDNVLSGGDGADRLVGGGGSDQILGGAGDDVLLAGSGADHLDGGTGRDRVDYILSKQGITIDLSNSAANTGGAHGDVLANIEDVSGSLLSDWIAGDGQANWLLGLSGDDQLFGRGGADDLFGGAGNDLLVGGAGDDRLHGGSGADQFRFTVNDGVDRITDFNAQEDSIALDLALLGGTPATTADVIATYAQDQGSDLLLDFGSTQILLIGLDHPDDLAGAISFF